jgi:hypothetical protein
MSADSGTLGTLTNVTIPICSAEGSGAGGCGHCLTSSAGPVCRSDVGERCLAPVLAGPAALVERLMAELDRVLAVQADGEATASGLIHALMLRDGEAELTLGVSRRCGGALLADTAFQTLRRLLPDTDIYINHAA